MIKKIKILNDEGERLDKFLASRFSNYSRNYFQHLIDSDNVLVNGLPQKSKFVLNKNDQIQIKFMQSKSDYKLNPSEIELDVIFENEDVLAINKQAGLVVHPATGNLEGTLVNALIYKYPEIVNVVYDKNSAISQSRPGIVHRLDKDTSGIILIAKNKRALVSLSKQIKNRSVRKIYWAICFGWPKQKQGRIISYLGRNPKNRKEVTNLGPADGKEAVSVYRIIKYLNDNKDNHFSLVEFNIKTGRTHQIRYQAASINLPVMGDRVYGSKKSISLSNSYNISRQLLHAKHIEFYLPGNTKLTALEAPIPKDMELIINNFSNSD